MVGSWFDGSGIHGYGFLRTNGQDTLIEVPGAMGTEPEGLNNRGRVVGVWFDAQGVEHSFLFSDGVYSTLDFPGATGAYSISDATAINDHGEIAGAYNDFLHGYIAQGVPEPGVLCLLMGLAVPSAMLTVRQHRK